MKISFYTLGCKANQADNQTIQNAAAQIGWQIVPYGKKCDCTVINICAVTAGAEQRSRQMLRAAKQYTDCVIASGCFLNIIPEIDFYYKTPGLVIKFLKNIYSSDALPPPHGKTRALIRIQDGCNFNCSYCIINKIRGKTASRSSQEIISKIKQKQFRGCKEIVLTGINILQYKNISRLLKEILGKTAIPRIRLGSIDPRLANDEFINLFKNPRLLPHLHLSLQSGSDRILKLMNRNYTSRQYLHIIKRARQIDPLFSFTTDVITGFPNEKPQDHEKTLQIIKDAQFTKVHVFPYSDRPGTVAQTMQPKADQPTKKQRLKQIQQAAEQVKLRWLENYINRELEILFEERTDNKWFGYSPYYFKVACPSGNNLRNKIISLKIRPEHLI